MKKWTKRLPLGYDKTPEGWLVPVEEEKELLRDMKEMLDNRQISLRDAAMIISSRLDKNISYEGLRRRLSQGIDYLDEGEDDASPN
jgi:hypothetical protein